MATTNTLEPENAQQNEHKTPAEILKELKDSLPEVIKEHGVTGAEYREIIQQIDVLERQLGIKKEEQTNANSGGGFVQSEAWHASSGESGKGFTQGESWGVSNANSDKGFAQGESWGSSNRESDSGFVQGEAGHVAAYNRAQQSKTAESPLEYADRNIAASELSHDNQNSVNSALYHDLHNKTIGAMDDLKEHYNKSSTTKGEKSVIESQLKRHVANLHKIGFLQEGGFNLTEARNELIEKGHDEKSASMLLKDKILQAKHLQKLGMMSKTSDGWTINDEQRALIQASVTGKQSLAEKIATSQTDSFKDRVAKHTSAAMNRKPSNDMVGDAINFAFEGLVGVAMAAVEHATVKGFKASMGLAAKYANKKAAQKKVEAAKASKEVAKSVGETQRTYSAQAKAKSLKLEKQASQPKKIKSPALEKSIVKSEKKQIKDSLHKANEAPKAVTKQATQATKQNDGGR